MAQVSTYPADVLREFSARVLEAASVPPDDAAQAADVLLAADLRGIDSHGVARLRGYSDVVRSGQVNARPEPRVVRCLLEAGPLPLSFRLDGECLQYNGNYHQRPRIAGSICA